MCGPVNDVNVCTFTLKPILIESVWLSKNGTRVNSIRMRITIESQQQTTQANQEKKRVTSNTDVDRFEIIVEIMNSFDV